MPSSAVQKTVFGLVATALTFLLAVIANGLLSYRINEVKYWTLHTHQVIEGLKDALLALEDAESEDRGYALTGNEEFLIGYNSGKEGVVKSLDRVARLTEDNPDQQRLVAEAKSEAVEKLVLPMPSYKSMTSPGPKVCSIKAMAGKSWSDLRRPSPRWTVMKKHFCANEATI